MGRPRPWPCRTRAREASRGGDMDLRRRLTRSIASFGRVIAAWVLWPLATAAAVVCPPDTFDMCTCVGAAKDFNLVAQKKINIKQGRIAYYGYAYPIEVYVEGDTCALRASVSGPVNYPTYMYNLAALATPG